MTLVKDIMLRLRAVRFERVLADVRRLLERLFSNFTSTKVTEDYFQRCADKATDKNDNTMSNASVWSQAVEQHLLDQLYNYKEVSRDDVDEERCTTESIPASMYRPSYREASLPGEFKSLLGKGRPSWPTYDPANQVLLAEQLRPCCTCAASASSTMELRGLGAHLRCAKACL